MQNWEADYNRKVARLSGNRAFSEDNRAIVLDYLRFKQSQNLTYHRMHRIIDFLWHFLERCDYDLIKITQDRINDTVIWINGNKEWKG